MEPAIVIDCIGIKSADEFWRVYLESAAPDGTQHFGRNLDAFWDAIEAGGPGRPASRVLRFQNSSELSGIGSGSFLDALRQMASEATSVKLSFE